MLEGVHDVAVESCLKKGGEVPDPESGGIEERPIAEPPQRIPISTRPSHFGPDLESPRKVRIRHGHASFCHYAPASFRQRCGDISHCASGSRLSGRPRLSPAESHTRNSV